MRFDPSYEASSLEWAKHYRKMGFSVIPLKSPETHPDEPEEWKRPILSEWRTYQERRSSEEELEEWFEGRKRNIAVVCGEVSNLLVFDFDTPELFDSFCEDFGGKDEILGKTRVVRTGGGYHVYFRLKSEIPEWLRSQKWEDEDFEIKWNGTYVVAPPSTHPSGKCYEVVRQEAIFTEREVEDFLNKLALWVQQELGIDIGESSEGGICVSRLLDGVSEGKRNNTLFKLAVFMARSGASKDWAKEVLKDYWNERNDPPFSGREMREMDKTIDSAFKGPRSSESEDYSLYFDQDPDRYEITLSTEDGEKVPVVQRKEEEEGDEEKSQLDKLITVGFDHIEKFIIDSVTDDEFAVIDGGGHLEARPLDSKFMRKFLGAKYYEEEEEGVSETAVNSAVNTLCGAARVEGEKRKLFTRVGEYDGSIYYDLCDEKWNAIEINENGWRIREDPPQIFQRWGHQEEQVKPSEGGDIDLLRDFLSNLSEPDWKVLKPVLPTMFVLDFPHFILAFFGPHGSTKSVIQRMIRSLIDPSAVELMAPPKSPDDAIVTLNANYVSFFDNLKEVKDWLGDILCRASTGEGYMKRELYTDRDQAPFAYLRCVGFNSIAGKPSQADLLDRSLIFELSHLPDSERTWERKLWRDFKEAKPKILGGMFDALSEAIRIYPKVETELVENEKINVPRMADAALWAESVARAMGYDDWEWLQLYNRKVGEKETFVLERNPIGLAVIALMKGRRKYESSPKKLLEKLEEVAEEKRDRHRTGEMARKRKVAHHEASGDRGRLEEIRDRTQARVETREKNYQDS